MRLLDGCHIKSFSIEECRAGLECRLARVCTVASCCVVISHPFSTRTGLRELSLWGRKTEVLAFFRIVTSREDHAFGSCNKG